MALIGAINILIVSLAVMVVKMVHFMEYHFGLLITIFYVRIHITTGDH